MSRSLEDDDRFGEAYEVPATPPEERPRLPSRAQRRAMDAEYRKLLKARLKYDKLVEPKGEKPIPIKRGPAKPKAPEPAEVDPATVKQVETNNFFVAGHYDEDEANPIVLMEETEFFGLFNFRDTILDQLERYEFYLNRMKRHDFDAYGKYKQVGMHLLPYLATGMTKRGLENTTRLTNKEIEKYKAEIVLPPMFNATRPAFGCVVFGANPRAEAWEKSQKEKGGGSRSTWLIPRFIYYTKLKKRPDDCQLVLDGDIYKMTVWWDMISPKVKWGTPTEFAIFIDKTGLLIKLLKTCRTEFISIKEKRGLAHFEIPDRHWHFPHEYAKWAAKWGLDPDTHLCHLFTSMVRGQEWAQFGDVRVQVHKDDITAIFHVDSRRMAYFFKDRDYQQNEKGHRKRIFHIRAPFVDKNGVAHPIQYRGEKHFTWAGYEVDVTVPGLDHFIQDDFNVAAIDVARLPKRKDYLTGPELGTRIVEMIKRGDGGVHR